jgi:hypothetical protein
MLADRVLMFEFDAENRYLSPQIAMDITKLWRTSMIQKAYQRRSEFWALDAADYYFENVLISFWEV